jgi:hypothetical protein
MSIEEPSIEAKTQVQPEEVARVVADLKANTLAPMPGRFSRLIYLASLRDYNTGRYHHYGLETRYPAAAVDVGLHNAHVAIFEELMALPLEDQTRDLIQAFDSIREDKGRVISTWKRLKSYQVLPPDQSHPLARQLFDQNIEVMLRVLRETDLWALLHEPHGNANHLP